NATNASPVTASDRFDHSTVSASFYAFDDADNTYLLDAFLTKTSTDTWQLAVFDSAARSTAGVFPYSSAPLINTTLSFSQGQLQNSAPIAIVLPDGRTVHLRVAGLTEVNA